MLTRKLNKETNKQKESLKEINPATVKYRVGVMQKYFKMLHSYGVCGELIEYGEVFERH
jgi:hypothetical protein